MVWKVYRKFYMIFSTNSYKLNLYTGDIISKPAFGNSSITTNELYGQQPFQPPQSQLCIKPKYL